MRGGAERPIDAVDLEANRATGYPKVTDGLVRPNPLEDEACPRVEAIWQSLITPAAVEAEGGGANPDETLWRATELAPQPTWFAGEAVVMLTGLGFPGNAPLAICGIR